MPSIVAVEKTTRFGKKFSLYSESPVSERHAVSFDNSRANGYFYGQEDGMCADALLIHNKEHLFDKDQDAHIEILWSEDGLKSALVIDGTPHAVFDFEASRGYCRTGEPEPDGLWTEQPFIWDDSIMEKFR